MAENPKGAVAPLPADDAGAIELESYAPGPSFAEPLVGECIGVDPTRAGRVLVRIVAGSTTDRWLPILQGLPVRLGDRLLLVKPANWPEALVTGVVDGFSRRPEAPLTTAAVLTLAPDEKLEIASADGVPIVEIRSTSTGPVLRLRQPDVSLELPGELRISARNIELIAREGQANVSAAGDVNVRGETINLN